MDLFYILEHVQTLIRRVPRTVQYAFHKNRVHHYMGTTGSRYTHGVHHLSASVCAGNRDDSEKHRGFCERSWDLMECGAATNEGFHGWHHQPHKMCWWDSKAAAADGRNDCLGPHGIKAEEERDPFTLQRKSQTPTVQNCRRADTHGGKSACQEPEQLRAQTSQDGSKPGVSSLDFSCGAFGHYRYILLQWRG